MQPTGTKKNPATCRDKKSCNVSGQKTDATSWDKKKITQSFGTNKKSCNLAEQNKITQTSQDKKNHKVKNKKKIIMNSIGWPLNPGSPGS